MDPTSERSAFSRKVVKIILDFFRRPEHGPRLFDAGDATGLRRKRPSHPSSSVGQSDLPGSSTNDDLGSSRPQAPREISYSRAHWPGGNGKESIKNHEGRCGSPRWEIAEPSEAIVGDTGGDQEVSPVGGQSPPQKPGRSAASFPGEGITLNSKKRFRRTVSLLQ